MTCDKKDSEKLNSDYTNSEESDTDYDESASDEPPLPYYELFGHPLLYLVA